MSEKSKNAYLVQLGARAVSGDPMSGLRENGAGGRNYIRRLVEDEWSVLPFERIFYAPIPLARQTKEAIVEAAHDRIWMDENKHPIEERPELYPNESLPAWQKISSRLPKESATLADIKRSVEVCIKEGLVAGDFLDQEAARIFGFVENQTLSISAGETILYLLPSPLPEAIVVWLHETRPHRELQKQRPLSAMRTLSPLDGFRFIFQDGKLVDLLLVDNREKVRKLVLIDVLKQRLDKDGKEGRALAEYGLPLVVERENK